MQMHAQATAGQLQAGPTGLPPGLLAGHPGAPPGGIPASLSLLTGIPSSLSTPHPAFASLLAQQKPALVPDAALLMARSREEEMKRESNGGMVIFWKTDENLDISFLNCPLRASLKLSITLR